MRFALALEIAREDALARELVARGFEVAVRAGTAAELAARLPTAAVDVALIGAGPQYLDVELVRVADSQGVRLLALAAHAADADRARAIGVQSVPADMPFAEMAPLLEAAPTLPAPPAPGRIITVWGTHGAPGRTTAAIALATEFAVAGRSCVLVDADTHAASVAPALGLLDEAPGFAAAARLAKQRSLDAVELDRVAQTYEGPGWSFRVLTGIGRADRWPELQADRVAGVLAECRAWQDCTVVDVGASLESDDLVSSDLYAPRRNAATLAALNAADTVVAVVGADPVSLTRFLRVSRDLAEIVEPDRIRVVINRARRASGGLAPGAAAAETLERFAGLRAHAIWPDERGVDAAVAEGKTVREVASRSQLRKRMTETAQSLLPAGQRTTRQALRAAERAERRGSTRKFGRRRAPETAQLH